LPKAPGRPAAVAITTEVLAARVDQFLASRGYGPGAGTGTGPSASSAAPSPPAREPGAASGSTNVPVQPETPSPFVCEDDVRSAIKEGRQILVGDRTIITPAARDAGEAARVFRQAGWPGTRS
jgi:acetaldehyde dehydrogenase (acetylating)